jgi:hypothetical protein
VEKRRKNTEVIYVRRYFIAHGPTLHECFWLMAFRSIQLINPALPLHTFLSYRFTAPAVTHSLAGAKEFFLKYRLLAKIYKIPSVATFVSLKRQRVFYKLCTGTLTIKLWGKKIPCQTTVILVVAMKPNA